MADRVHIRGGDEIDEGLLAELFGRAGISDYVERGVVPAESDVDFTNAVVDVPEGKAFVLDNSRDAMLLADARAGVQLPTDGVAHLYIYYDLAQPEGERIGYHVDSDQTSPAHPALRIAAIDMAAESVAPKNDTAPIYRRDAETYKGNDIDSDGDGVVDEADSAGAADTATSADTADEAAVAAGLQADAAGESAPIDVDGVLDYQLNNIQNLKRSRIRHNADNPDTGLDTYLSQYGSQTAVRLAPVYQGAIHNDLELKFLFGYERWQFATRPYVGTDAVLVDDDASGLSVSYADSAGTADTADALTGTVDADTLGGIDPDTVLSAQSGRIPSAALDPGESVWVPLYTGGGASSARVLELTAMLDSYDWTQGVEASIQTPSGKVVGNNGDPPMTGTIDNPIASTSVSTLKLHLENRTSSTVGAGAACRYVLVES